MSQACLDRDQQPATGPSSARASWRAFKNAVKKLDRPLQGDHERDADPAVLHPAVRPLGGLRGRAPAAAALLQSVKNVIFLTTDVHATLINDARFQTLEPGGAGEQRHHGRDRRPGGHRELRRSRSTRRPAQPGSGRSSTARSSRRRRPAGSGMQCSVLDQFSYGQVKVTSTAADDHAEGHRRAAADRTTASPARSRFNLRSLSVRPLARSPGGAGRAAGRRPGGAGGAHRAAGLLRRDVRPRHREGAATTRRTRSGT